MQGLIPCVSPLATCPPLCLIVWKIDMWLCIVLDWVRGWVARVGFLLPALSPDPPDLLDSRRGESFQYSLLTMGKFFTN